MKNILLIFCFCTSIIVAQPPHAKHKTQGKGKIDHKHNHKHGHDGVNEVKEKDGKHKENKSHKKKWHKGHQGKGHAHGKNKDGLSGKEFGHERAGEAKNKVKYVCDEGDRAVSELSLRIEKARGKIETEVKNGSIYIKVSLDKKSKTQTCCSKDKNNN